MFIKIFRYLILAIISFYFSIHISAEEFYAKFFVEDLTSGGISEIKFDENLCFKILNDEVSLYNIDHHLLSLIGNYRITFANGDSSLPEVLSDKTSHPIIVWRENGVRIFYSLEIDVCEIYDVAGRRYLVKRICEPYVDILYTELKSGISIIKFGNFNYKIKV